MKTMVMSKNKQPHPLEHMAWKAFAENDHQDGTTLAYFLAGASVRGGGNKAYRTVALDVLGYMEDQGLLYREGGWWRPYQWHKTAI